MNIWKKYRVCRVLPRSYL